MLFLPHVFSCFLLSRLGLERRAVISETESCISETESCISETESCNFDTESWNFETESCNSEDYFWSPPLLLGTSFWSSISLTRSVKTKMSFSKLSHSVNFSRKSSPKKLSIVESQSRAAPSVSLHPLFKSFNKNPLLGSTGVSILKF